MYDRQNTPASETSAVPRALFRPQVSRTEQTATRYFHLAFDKLHDELTGRLKRTKLSTHPEGALQLVKNCSLWPDAGSYHKLSRAEASHLACAELASEALYFPHAGSLDASALCRYWMAQCQTTANNCVDFTGNTTVHSVQQTANGWQLLDADNIVIDESPLVIVASAEVASGLSETAHLPLQKSRGQISHFFANKTDGLPNLIVTGKGSVIPTSTGFWAGSTHQRQFNSSTPSERDDQLNLQRALALCPQLKETTEYEDTASHSWAGFRYSTPDRLPIVGAAPVKESYLQQYADIRHGRCRQSFPPAKFHNGLYLLTGFGSRGALHSVHASEILTNLITATATPSNNELHSTSRMLHPARFIIRQLRRGL